MFAPFTITRLAVERTVRLVSTARLRPPVLGDLVPPEMMDALLEVEGATSNRLVGQNRGTAGVNPREFVYGVPHSHFINASFAYARPSAPNRFNGTDRGAWYSALVVDTCVEEVKYHLTRELAYIGEFKTKVEYAEMFASFAGEFLDLREAEGDHDCLHPEPHVGYPAGNALSDAVLAKGLNGIVYPSVRHKDGTCFVALSPHAVQSVAQGEVWTLEWTGSPEPVVTQAKLAA